jgi:hypothetical protein
MTFAGLIRAVAALFVLAICQPALGQTRSPWAFGATAGTDGAGLDAKYRVNSFIVLRGRVAGLRFSGDEDDSGTHYGGKVKFATLGGFVDWHPFGNGFLFSGGALGGDREVDLSGAPNTNLKFHGHTYTPSQIGTVYGRGKLPTVGGFVGLGYDNAFTHPSKLNFNVLLGVQLGGSPKVALSSTGLLATTPQLQGDLRSEEDELRSDMNFARYYPAISIGLGYRF